MVDFCRPSYIWCFNWLTCNTKSLPLKSALVRGSLVLPQTNLRNSDLSLLLNSSIICQNHFTNGALGPIPLYVHTDFNNCTETSWLPQTSVSNSSPVKSDSKGTGITLDMPSRIAFTCWSNSCSLMCRASRTYSWQFPAVTCVQNGCRRTFKPPALGAVNCISALANSSMLSLIKRRPWM